MTTSLQLDRCTLQSPPPRGVAERECARLFNMALSVSLRLGVTTHNGNFLIILIHHHRSEDCLWSIPSQLRRPVGWSLSSAISAHMGVLGGVGAVREASACLNALWGPLRRLMPPRVQPLVSLLRGEGERAVDGDVVAG
jgi:hypothetical protein